MTILGERRKKKDRMIIEKRKKQEGKQRKGIFLHAVYTVFKVIGEG